MVGIEMTTNKLAELLARGWVQKYNGFYHREHNQDAGEGQVWLHSLETAYTLEFNGGADDE